MSCVQYISIVLDPHRFIDPRFEPSSRHDV